MVEKLIRFLFKPDVISEHERMSLVGDRAREMKMTTHEKKKMTRKEAIEIFKKHMPDVVKAESTVDFYIEAGMLEIVEEEKRKFIDWNKPLKLITNHGTLEVLYLGHDLNNKRVVHILIHSSMKTTFIDYYNPDDNGYVVQFDRWIENKC